MIMVTIYATHRDTQQRKCSKAFGGAMPNALNMRASNFSLLASIPGRIRMYGHCIDSVVIVCDKHSVFEALIV